MWINLDPKELELIKHGIGHIIDAEATALRARLDEWEAESRSERSKKYRDAAFEHYHRDGELEVDNMADDTCCVSEGDDPGAYVMAWRWVDSDLAGVTFTCESCDSVFTVDERDSDDPTICKQCAREEEAE